MAVVVFDIRGAERRLKEAGMSPVLAATQAEIMSESFVHHADQLVTMDYLDTKFSEYEARFETRFTKFESGFEKRFAKLESGFETRFAKFESGFETRFAKFESAFETRFAKFESAFETRSTKSEANSENRFTRIDGQFKLIYWILAVNTTAVVIPLLQSIQ